MWKKINLEVAYVFVFCVQVLLKVTHVHECVSKYVILKALWMSWLYNKAIVLVMSNLIPFDHTPNLLVCLKRKKKGPVHFFLIAITSDN